MSCKNISWVHCWDTTRSWVLLWLYWNSCQWEFVSYTNISAWYCYCDIYDVSSTLLIEHLAFPSFPTISPIWESHYTSFQSLPFQSHLQLHSLHTDPLYLIPHPRSCCYQLSSPTISKPLSTTLISHTL